MVINTELFTRYNMKIIYIMDKFHIRKITSNDYNKGIIELYSQFFTINSTTIGVLDFQKYIIDQCNDNHVIFVVEQNNKIMACATCFIETKIIHNFGKVAHVEDVVVDATMQGLGLGKKIIDTCIEYANDKQCYKIILDCSDKNMAFYEKCGFTQNGNMMNIYFKIK
tara:strand:- start:137 stop:637 length:501 start_codon:yes stop_codon:yes gene_type:complete